MAQVFQALELNLYLQNRGFLNTHQPQMIGKQFGFIISGPLRQNSNITECIQAIAELDKSNLVNIITDEYECSDQVDTLLDNFAKQLIDLSQKKYIRPPTFLGVAGTKLFRDEMWGKLRFVFQADYRFYKKHKMMDFPQKNIGVRLANLLIMPLTKIPPVKKYFQREMKEMMIIQFKNFLKNI